MQSKLLMLWFVIDCSSLQNKINSKLLSFKCKNTVVRRQRDSQNVEFWIEALVQCIARKRKKSSNHLAMISFWIIEEVRHFLLKVFHLWYLFEFCSPSESETNISLKVFVRFEMKNLTTKNHKGHKKNNSDQTN